MRQWRSDRGGRRVLSREKRRCGAGGEHVDEFRRRGGDVDQPAMFRLEQSAEFRVVQEGEQMVVVAVDVQKPARLAVDAELKQADRVEELIQRAEAAGQRQPGVGEFQPSI